MSPASTAPVRSRYRLVSVFFSILLIGLSGYLGIWIMRIGLLESQFPVVGFGLLFFGLALAGVFAIRAFLLQVTFDPGLSRITLSYPLQRKSVVLSAGEILGFGYQYIQGGVSGYKALQIRSTNGEKFTFSSFETANLREFESAFRDHLEVRGEFDFAPLTEEKKQVEYQKSEKFELEQAKTNRLIWVFAVVLSLFGAWKYLTQAPRGPVAYVGAAVICGLIALGAWNAWRKTKQEGA